MHHHRVSRPGDLIVYVHIVGLARDWEHKHPPPPSEHNLSAVGKLIFSGRKDPLVFFRVWLRSQHRLELGTHATTTVATV